MTKPTETRPDGVEVYDTYNYSGADVRQLRAKLREAEEALQHLIDEAAPVNALWAKMVYDIAAPALAALRGTEPPAQNIMTGGGTEEAASGQVHVRGAFVDKHWADTEAESGPGYTARYCPHCGNSIMWTGHVCAGDTDQRLADHGLLHRDGIDRQRIDEAFRFVPEYARNLVAGAPDRKAGEDSQTTPPSREASGCGDGTAEVATPPPATCPECNGIGELDSETIFVWACGGCGYEIRDHNPLTDGGPAVVIPRAELRQLVEALRQARDTVMLVDDTTHLDNALDLPCARAMSEDADAG